MSRRWTINGRFLQQPMTGVQRYGREIVRALDKALTEKHPLAKDLDIQLMIPPGCTLREEFSRISVRTAGRSSGHVWEQVYLQRGAADQGLLSLCNTGPIAHRRQIVCIHDLNTRLAATSYSPAFRMLYRVIVPALGRTAERIATVSHFSADQLESFRVCPERKIRVIPNGSEHAIAWCPSHSEKTRAAAGKSTILVLGSRAPHKNVELLLGLADELAKRGLRLAVAGASNPKIFASDEKLAEKTGVIWLGRISDEEFAAMLDDCLCLAFPSLTEGFGLPPLEAMARGCPVVVSNRASLPEVCGAAALYASPEEPASWLSQFERLRDSPELQEKLSTAGRARAGCFTWRRSAELYLEAMAECDGFVSALSPAIH